MSNANVARDAARPRCEKCGVPMRLVEVSGVDNPALERCTFKCEVCGATATALVDRWTKDQS